ncbi:cupin domain-containing protein [Streptomyces sp. CBMA156]|uniref:cupin domain-containing protein n=1 Tax=Streptomyces sp. CBMA156 TaxID=1930280 RepID=UPI00166191CB|nr:cupin domain-containing protein [Streptomyces sp. CBMA156]MBD0677031.1 hypothetical protein [Streptomyces sp. CBMA156]
MRELPRDEISKVPTLRSFSDVAGIAREEAFDGNGLWAGFVRIEKGSTSGWHTHPAWESVAHIVSGSVRLDYGPGGAKSVEAGPGDWLYEPAGIVHRKAALESDVLAVVFRYGHGPIVQNVDGPEEEG